jgi:hypothetical protein
MDMVEFQARLNGAKELFIAQLVKEGLIDVVTGAEIVENYALVAREQGMFGRLIDRIWGDPDKGKIMITVVKMAGSPSCYPKGGENDDDEGAEGDSK